MTGKITYTRNLLKYYPQWYLILAGRLLNFRLKSVKLTNGLTITGGEKSLITDLIDEIFINEVYNPPPLTIKKGDTVIDIGANIGVFSLYAARQGAKHIYSIDPIPENTSLIRQNFKINKLKQPKIYTKAILDKQATAKFYLGDIDSHGLVSNKKPNDIFNTSTKVKTDTLANIITSNHLDKIDYLKMDCEGSEGLIISTLPMRFWKKINKVAIEYHNNYSSLSDTQIKAKLIRAGFTAFSKANDKNFGYVYGYK